jgi:hypothetical protein
MNDATVGNEPQVESKYQNRYQLALERLDTLHECIRKNEHMITPALREESEKDPVACDNSDPPNSSSMVVNHMEEIIRQLEIMAMRLSNQQTRIEL